MAGSREADAGVNRVFLWMNPRSLSTAFTKCVGLMDGNCTWFEPYTMCIYLEYFSNPDIVERYPQIARLRSTVAEAGKNIETHDNTFSGGNLKTRTVFSYEWVQEELSKPLPPGKKFLFVKDTGFSITNRFDMLPKVPFKHTFLIRDPLRAAESNRRIYKLLSGLEGSTEDFDMYESSPTFNPDLQPPNPCYNVWKYVKDNIDPNPVVIDADDLQNFPEQILRKYCEAVGIQFKTKYLQWEESYESTRDYNGCIEQLIVGKHVYQTAYKSCKFEPIKSAKPNFEDLPPDCQRFVLENREGYKEMYESRIKPDQC